jgi:hypothetical protein
VPVSHTTVTATPARARTRTPTCQRARQDRGPPARRRPRSPARSRHDTASRTVSTRTRPHDGSGRVGAAALSASFRDGAGSRSSRPTLHHPQPPNGAATTWPAQHRKWPPVPETANLFRSSRYVALEQHEPPDAQQPRHGSLGRPDARPARPCVMRSRARLSRPPYQGNYWAACALRFAPVRSPGFGMPRHERAVELLGRWGAQERGERGPVCSSVHRPLTRPVLTPVTDSSQLSCSEPETPRRCATGRNRPR